MNHSSRLLDSLPNLSFASVAGNWALPLVVYDHELRFVYANKAYLEATNTTWSQIDGQFIFDIFPEVPQRRAPVEALMREALMGESTTLEAVPYEITMPDGSRQMRVWQAVQDPYRNADGDVTHLIQRAEDITAQVELKRQNDFMQNELAHRIRNMFAVIMATSRIAGESADNVDTFVDDFNERLASMSRVYSNLTQSDWTGLSLRKIMVEELDAIAGRGSERYTLNGGDVFLTVKGSKDAALIIHELAANARKFGCFSTPKGHLTVEWSFEGEIMHATWSETGVPDVQPPTRVGLGTRVFDMFPGIKATRTITEDGMKIFFEVPILKSEIEPEIN
jgi:PAS domain S-box-containing protein